MFNCKKKNHSETTCQPNQSKYMILGFPGINSLQIHVSTKHFESWIHYWTVPLYYTNFVSLNTHPLWIIGGRVTGRTFQLNEIRRCPCFANKDLKSTTLMEINSLGEHEWSSDCDADDRETCTLTKHTTLVADLAYLYVTSYTIMLFSVYHTPFPTTMETNSRAVRAMVCHFCIK